MEAEMVPSLSPLLQGADEWGDVLLLLPLLVALEAVLSADNAIALAAISRRLHDPARQRQALNLGLLMALVLRMALILAARWVLDAWPLQLAAAAYLLWLCGRHLLGLDEGTEDGEGLDGDEPLSSGERFFATAIPDASIASVGASLAPVHSVDASPVLQPGQHPSGPHPGHKGPTLASIALTLALTDLAFSLDSVAAAVAVTDRLALVMAGGLLGVLALRLTAGLFVRWLELFSRLETAGYLAVGLVGIRLLLRLLLPDLEVPEWLLLVLVGSLFVWGFSKRSAAVAQKPAAAAQGSAEGHGPGAEPDSPALDPPADAAPEAPACEAMPAPAPPSSAVADSTRP